MKTCHRCKISKEKFEFKKTKGGKIYANCIACNQKSLQWKNGAKCTWRRLCKNENCETCFNRSFASHEKAHCWSYKNDFLPREVFLGSDKKAWLNCNKCEHDFEGKLENISIHGSWCPYCCDPAKKLCEDENCIQCFEKSFASHEKSKYWSVKNELTPREVFLGSSSKKSWFNCENEHEFEMTLNNVNNGHWCPKCMYKTQTI